MAERSLRLAVTKRKVGGGHAQWTGSQTADLLSVIQTCRRQGRSIIEFFKQALMAKSGSEISYPSLLPQPTTNPYALPMFSGLTMPKFPFGTG